MYEVETRELPSRILLAESLLKKIDYIKIFQHSQLTKICLFNTPGILFIKSTPYQLDLLLKIAKRRGFIIFSAQEEGIHFSGDKESFGTLYPITFSRNTANLIDIYLAWHRHDFETAVRVGVPAKKIKIVGNVRLKIMDRLTNPRIINTKNKKILLITNFNYTNQLNSFRKGKRSKKQSDYEKIFQQAIPFYDQNLKVFQETEKLFLELIEKSSHFNLEITLRRYFYDTESFNEITYQNIILDGNYMIGNSINDCDLVIHYGSTAAIEAICGNRVPILLTSDLNFHDSRLLALGPSFTQVDDLLSWIDSLSEKALVSELSKSHTSLYVNYGIDVNLDSVELISNEILKTLENYENNKKMSVVILLNFVQYVKVFLNSLRQFVGKQIKLLTSLNSKKEEKAPKANKIRVSLIKTLATELRIVEEMSRHEIKISRNKKSFILKRNSGP
jgi:surface carbohydrate biosynthesis protein